MTPEDELRAEVNEQARLLAMSSEREAKLLAEVALCNGTIESRDRNIEELTAQCERLRKDEQKWRETVAELAESLEMVRRLEEHLDYTGWGDSYERECSEQLRKELKDFNKRQNPLIGKEG